MWPEEHSTDAFSELGPSKVLMLVHLEREKIAHICGSVIVWGYWLWAQEGLGSYLGPALGKFRNKYNSAISNIILIIRITYRYFSYL